MWHWSNLERVRQSWRINWTIGYCLYVEERVHSSYVLAIIKHLSNCLFTLGEPNHQHGTMQLLFMYTVDLQNEDSTVECWTSTFTSTLHIWRFSYYQWRHTHSFERRMILSTLAMLEDLFVMRTTWFHFPSLTHCSYLSHSNLLWRCNRMILHHKRSIQVSLKWDEGGLFIKRRREVELEKETLLHTKKHPAPISTLSREGRSIHHLLTPFSLSTLSVWQA